MLGWWGVSDVAKYLQRISLYEATERIEMSVSTPCACSQQPTASLIPATA